jgi:hypothetical protein
VPGQPPPGIPAPGVLEVRHVEPVGGEGPAASGERGGAGRSCSRQKPPCIERNAQPPGCAVSRRAPTRRRRRSAPGPVTTVRSGGACRAGQDVGLVGARHPIRGVATALRWRACTTYEYAHRPADRPRHQGRSSTTSAPTAGSSSRSLVMPRRRSRRLLQAPEGEVTWVHCRETVSPNSASTCPDDRPPLAAYVPAVLDGSRVYTSGQLPMAGGVDGCHRQGG